eukprot:2350689-Pleurochrysis_carterae.AAC.1
MYERAAVHTPRATTAMHAADATTQQPPAALTASHGRQHDDTMHTHDRREDAALLLHIAI